MTVHARKIWYFHGLDPATTARYRRIFASASQRLNIELEDLPDDAEGWRVLRGGVTSDLNYLRYEDLVRDFQRGGLLMRLGRGLRTLIAYAADGALWRLPRRSVALVISPLAVALTPVLALAALSSVSLPLALGLSAVLCTIAAVLLLRLRMILAADLFAYMRVLAQGERLTAEAYRERQDALADQITLSDADETLIVGHSLGGLAAIHAVATLVDRLGPQDRINLLTLGSVHGIVLAQKGWGQARLASSIARIAGDPRVFWVDVSSLRDPFCVPLTDPLLQIGDRTSPTMSSPKVIAAQIARAPRITGDRRTLFSAMRLHMGYLLAAPDGAGFDYADTVSGDLSLEERFSERGNSPKARMWRT